MDKKQIKLLQDIIENLNNIQIETRYKTIEFFKHFNYLKYVENHDLIPDEDLKKQDEKLDKTNDLINFYDEKHFELMFKLNNLLDYKDKNKEVMKLEEKMKEIQVKKFITTEEFEKIYNISKSSQRDYRGRLYNPLPYHQKIAKGKIVYVVEEVEKWFENQYK